MASPMRRPAWPPAARDRPCFPLRFFFRTRRRRSRVAREISGLEFHRWRVLVERDPDGIAPGGHGVELISQHPPDHQDTAIALAEMLLGMQRYRSLADLRLVIAWELLMFLFGHVPPELAVELRAHPSDVAGLLDPASDVDTERGVVARQRPAARLDAGELCDPRIGHHPQGRKNSLDSKRTR